jgi:hypothetical protein
MSDSVGTKPPAERLPPGNIKPDRQALHFLQRYGAIASIGSFFIGLVIVTFTIINFN